MDNLTVWQKLTKSFGYANYHPDTPTYRINKDELLRKSTSPEDFNKNLLQAQQTEFLHDKWKKIENSLYNQSIYYEPNRLSAYYDFESMEFTPEISASLDIYAEESTTISEKGEMLTIYSESPRVKSILSHLFNKVIMVDTVLPMWTRNVCKYGENFVYLKLDDEYGVVGCKQLPNIEIERKENGNPLNINADNLHNDETKFLWRNHNLEMVSWEIAHFRLLGDDRKLPYGTSMLDKVRRIWKQLLLAEDAMLIYRTSRAPERRVFKVFVGNMDDKDIDAYVQRVASKFKRDSIVDKQTGNVDMRYNQMAVDQDFFIPVRDMNAPNPIDTLPGAQNLGQIQDIEYIQKKLLSALRIPKAFLGFEETVGDGKNLSMLDVRFARTINRIQKSMIQELNRIASIHLKILGLDDELDNFTLGLNNPSTQSDLLKIEQWKEKITLYKDATSDQSQLGILPVSHTWAKKNILNMSDNEIIMDLEQQRLERAIGVELINTQNIIRRTRVFDNVDAKFGIPEEEREKIDAKIPDAMGEIEPQTSSSPEPTPEQPEAISEAYNPILINENEDLKDLFSLKKAKENYNNINNLIKE